MARGLTRRGPTIRDRFNVVYDLRYATDHFPGIGTHAHALLDALLHLPAPGRYRVLWGASDRTTRFDPRAFATHPRVDWTVGDAPALGVRAPFATGAWLRRLGGDLYLSPFYLKPVGAGMPAVLTLPDAMHLAPEAQPPWPLRVSFGVALRHAAGAAAAITPSEFSRRELIRRAGFPSERLHVIPQGVPPRAEVSARRPADVPEQAFALVVGGNRPHKDLRTLARAWRRLGDTRPLDLVGAGPVDPRFPSLAQLAREEGAPGVRALGAIAPEVLEWLYANATLLVFPSRYEGFGFPLLEAAVRGTPVLASDIPALREIGDGVARFVPAGDPVAWASAVRELAADAAERARLRAAGLAAAAGHDYARVAERTYALLERVMAERGGGDRGGGERGGGERGGGERGTREQAQKKARG